MNEDQIPEKVKKALRDGNVANAASSAARDWLDEHGFTDDLKKMEGYLIRKDRTAVDDFYSAGKLAVKIYQEHSNQEAIEALQYMGKVGDLKYRTIRSAYLFAMTFNDDHVAAIKEIKFANGQPATQTHLMMLMVDYIPTAEDRIEVLQMAAKANIPANKLNAFIQDLYGRSSDVVTGRKDAVPTTKEALLEQMVKPAADLIRKCDTVWLKPDDTGAVALLSDDMDGVTFETRQDLLDTIATYETLQERIPAILNILRAQDSTYLDAAIRNNQTDSETNVANIREEVRVTE